MACAFADDRLACQPSAGEPVHVAEVFFVERSNWVEMVFAFNDFDPAQPACSFTDTRRFDIDANPNGDMKQAFAWPTLSVDLLGEER